jgi:hypothetical protein
MGQSSRLAASDARTAHRVPLPVDAERLGRPAQRRQVLGHRGRRPPGTLKCVAAGPQRFRRQLVSRRVRA